MRAAILGTAGYSGQETLDRVLAHPGLELAALGSDSLAGQPAAALDPRLARNGASAAPAFVTNDEALASGADVVFLCLGHEEAARIEPPAEGVVVDLSGGHRLATPPPTRSGTASPIPIPAGSSTGATRCRAAGAHRQARGEPRLLCDRGPARAPAARGGDRPGRVVVDAKSGVSGAGRGLKPESHAGHVLENLTPYKVGRHQHAAEIEQALGFPVCFVPHLLPVKRGLVASCYAHPLARDLRERLEAAYAGSHAVVVLPDGVAPQLARVQRTDAAEIGLFEDQLDRPRDRDLRARQPGQGRRGPGDPEREHRPRAARRRWPEAAGGARVSVTAAKGFVASGVECGIRRSGRDLAVVRSLPPAVGAGMFTTNRVQAAPVCVSKAHLAVAEPQAVVVNAGVANAATGERGERAALATAADAALLLDLRVEEVVVLSTGVIGVHLPLDRVRSGLERRPPSSPPTAGATRPPRSSPPTRASRRPSPEVTGFVVGGMAKGSGMIHPALATMLAVVTTDYPLAPSEADEFLRAAVESTFNRISVDGECSTNDAVVLLANGASSRARRRGRSPARSTRSAPASPARWSTTARGRRS